MADLWAPLDSDSLLPPDDAVAAMREAVRYERVFYQSVPDTDWVIVHDLPFVPAVTVLDSSGAVKIAPVEYVGDFEIHIRPGTPFAGSVLLR